LRNVPTRAPWAPLQCRSIDNAMLMQVVRELLRSCNTTTRLFSYGSSSPGPPLAASRRMLPCNRTEAPASHGGREVPKGDQSQPATCHVPKPRAVS
jgi:hypothetical protein